MTEQERQDLHTILKDSTPPTRLVELRKEYNDRFRRMTSEITPHRKHDGTYDLDKVVSINGKAVDKDLDKGIKRQMIHEEMAKVTELYGEVRTEAGLWNEARKIARMKLAGLPKNEIEIRDGPGPVDHEERASKEADKLIKAMKEHQGGISSFSDVPDLDVRALTGTGAGATQLGFPPESTRTGHMQWIGYQKPNLKELFPRTTTQMEVVKYMEEQPMDDDNRNTEGDDTANMRKVHTVAEGRLISEADVRFVERNAPVVKIAVRLSVSEEQIEDVPRMRRILPMKARQFLARRENYFVLYGEAAVNANDDTERPGFGGLNAMSARTGGRSALQTFAFDEDDNVPNLVHLAFTKVEEVGFADAGPVVMHPMGWHRIATLQSADGQYLWSHPSMNPVPMIWAHRVITNNNVVDGEAWTGDWDNHSEWCERIGAQIAWGLINDQFARDQMTLKIRTRAAIIFYRPSAFVKLTGLPTTN